MSADNKKITIVYEICAALIPLIMIFGNRSILGIRVIGLVMSPYRCIIPVMFLLLLALSIKEREIKSIHDIVSMRKSNAFIFAFCVIMIIWIAYGFISLLFFKYAVINVGIKEILVLLLSLMSVMCIYILCNSGFRVNIIIGMEFAVIVAMLIGFWEVISGNHLSTSRFCDPEVLKLLTGQITDISNIKLASSIFYNENDFSAFLAIMSPAFVMNVLSGNKVLKAFGAIALAAVYYLLYINDAFICLIAAIAGLLLTLIAFRPRLLDILITALSVTASRIVIFVLRFTSVSDSIPDVEGSFEEQLDNMEMGYGSMFYRLNTYKVTLRETLFTSKGIGFGAGSFTNYFSPFAESENTMINPHSYWLEILSEYGVVIFTIFVGFLIVLFLRLILMGTKNDRLMASLMAGMGTAFAIASNAPSSFLMHTYYWMVIGLSIYTVDCFDKVSGLSSVKAGKI